MTPATEALLAFDVDAVLAEARRRQGHDHQNDGRVAEVLASARRRNKASAFLYLQVAGRRGVRSDDPKTEALLARFRRDALRSAGVDERLVRGAA